MCYTLVPPLSPDYEDVSMNDHEGFDHGRVHFRGRRGVSTSGRRSCIPGAPVPLNQASSSSQLQKLRQLMQSASVLQGTFQSTAALQRQGIQAYIITTDDEHQSPYVAPHDKRRQFISGFSGSTGTAVVTLDRAALWIDGRYFLQAEDEVDCNWLLMKQGLRGTPSMTAWLRSELKPGDKVGADPHLIGALKWKLWRDALTWYMADILLVPTRFNLIDQMWTEEGGRPPALNQPVFVHDMKFAGKSWQEKVRDIRVDMTWRHVDLLVVTALDEVAWLLNLRGGDLPHSPVFKAYVLVTQQEVRLYIRPEKVSSLEIKSHLRYRSCYHPKTSDCVTLRNYEDIYLDISLLSNTSTLVYVPSRWSYAGGASYAIYNSVPGRKRILGPSPVLMMKARKNPTEVVGMQQAHVRDSVALCSFMAMLEEEVTKGKYWDEMSASSALEKYRRKQELFMGLSFPTISGFGAHAALIHYHPRPTTNWRLDNTSTYLLDSGAQYLDGTTDVTRTFHFGTPTDFQREAYTRVLMGSIDLAALEFTKGTCDADVDIIARRPLLEIGLDYKHGTGHGIGAFLLVHESPIQIAMHGRDHEFEEGHFLSAEPGYYQENEFGIRLETIIRVQHKNESSDTDDTLLGFQPVTLVPFEPKLIKLELLNKQQLDWLKKYNLLIRRKVGEEMKQQGQLKGYKWLMAKTDFLGYQQKKQDLPGRLPFAFRAVSTVIMLLAAI